VVSTTSLEGSFDIYGLWPPLDPGTANCLTLIP